MQYSAPSSSFGYYRGNPQFMGTGSGIGQNVAGNNQFAAGQGNVVGGAGTSNWTPTILYLFVLIVAEMFVFAFLSRHI